MDLSCISWASFATIEFVDFNKPYVEITLMLTEIYRNLYGNVLVSLNSVIKLPLWINFTHKIGFEPLYLINCLIWKQTAANKNPSIHSSEVWICFRMRESGKKHNNTSFQLGLHEDSFVSDSFLFQCASGTSSDATGERKAKGECMFTSLSHNKINLFLYKKIGGGGGGGGVLPP